MSNQSRFVGMLCLWIMLFAGAFLFSGCGSDDPVEVEAEYTFIIPPPTGDELFYALEMSYEDMSYDVFSQLLHPDFRIMLLDSTYDYWGGSAGDFPAHYFDKSRSLAAHHNLLNGEVGADRYGNEISGMDSIEWRILERIGPWSDVPDSLDYFTDFANARWATFDTRIHFHNDNNHSFLVDHELAFIVVTVEGGLNFLGIIPSPLEAGLNSFDYILSLYR